MAGPVQSYLTTQLAAQGAFSVPFGLLTLVNSSINAATAAGEFSITIDCSLFVAEDIANLTIYLESLGYFVEFAKNVPSKSLVIDWSKDVVGEEILVDQGSPAPLADGWPVKITDGTNVLGTPTNPLVVTSEGSAGTIVNVFSETDVIPTVETNIISYTVPLGMTLSILETIGWGTYDGEFLVRVNGIIKGGGRTSAAQRTLSLDYNPAPIIGNSGDTVTFTIQDYSSTTEHFRANLLGRLN